MRFPIAVSLLLALSAGASAQTIELRQADTDAFMRYEAVVPASARAGQSSADLSIEMFVSQSGALSRPTFRVGGSICPGHCAIDASRRGGACAIQEVGCGGGGNTPVTPVLSVTIVAFSVEPNPAMSLAEAPITLKIRNITVDGAGEPQSFDLVRKPPQ